MVPANNLVRRMVTVGGHGPAEGYLRQPWSLKDGHPLGMVLRGWLPSPTHGRRRLKREAHAQPAQKLLQVSKAF
jgi:hypothetical protein